MTVSGSDASNNKKKKIKSDYNYDFFRSFALKVYRGEAGQAK